ncbi:MAG: tyrosine-type recombinase/integrase, partial [Pseudonocardiaceae bacterium]|nr:tyrosine-type recombinase/integrase [Pseudonocardiaceae bacterium]
TGTDVHAWLLAECARVSVGSAKGRVAELRSLLRFLFIEGKTDTALAASVPPVAGWRDTALPPRLSATQVTTMLETCDRSTPIGRRDYAVLVVLARLGLRAAEVCGLCLEDLDWRGGELVVRGKGRRDDRLPLPADVGEAVAAHLGDPRPLTACRAVFLTRYAPPRPLAPGTVSNLVVRASRRAGVNPPVAAHRLRHTLASEMLRQGAVLGEISQVLRHRDLATTAIYAKVDHVVLRELAADWPVAP